MMGALRAGDRFDDDCGVACSACQTSAKIGVRRAGGTAPDTLGKVGAYADEVVCLHAPKVFYAVGQFYQFFPQVNDAEVIALLAAR
jgi:predicted phosphoribosyltransferase